MYSLETLSVVPSYIIDNVKLLQPTEKFYGFRNPYTNNPLTITYYKTTQDRNKHLIIPTLKIVHATRFQQSQNAWITFDCEPGTVYECLAQTFKQFVYQMQKLLGSNIVSSVTSDKGHSTVVLITDLAPAAHLHVLQKWACKLPSVSLTSVRLLHSCYVKTMQPFFAEHLWASRPQFVHYVMRLKNISTFTYIKKRHLLSVYTILSMYFDTIAKHRNVLRVLCERGILNTAISEVVDQNNFISACDDIDITLSFIKTPCRHVQFDEWIIKRLVGKIQKGSVTETISPMAFCTFYKIDVWHLRNALHYMYLNINTIDRHQIDCIVDVFIAIHFQNKSLMDCNNYFNKLDL